MLGNMAVANCRLRKVSTLRTALMDQPRQQFVAMKFLLLFAISLFPISNTFHFFLSPDAEKLPAISCVAKNLFCNSKRLITSHTLFRSFFSFSSDVNAYFNLILSFFAGILGIVLCYTKKLLIFFVIKNPTIKIMTVKHFLCCWIFGDFFSLENGIPRDNTASD